jgi:hypothetical protein
MKPTSLRILATVTMGTAASLIYQGMDSPRDPLVDATIPTGNAGSHETRDITIPSQQTPSSSIPGSLSSTASAGKPSSPRSSPAKTADISNGTRADNAPETSRPGGTAGIPELASAIGDVSNPSPPPSRTIQLAANFQLPAALLVSSSPVSLTSDEIDTPVEKATQAIVDAFYRKLADLPTEKIPSDTETIPAAGSVDGNLPQAEGENFIIVPNPETDAVRRRADELYRTLFGDEAFGRKGMDSTLEVRLPVVGDAPVR